MSQTRDDNDYARVNKIAIDSLLKEKKQTTRRNKAYMCVCVKELIIKIIPPVN